MSKAESGSAATQAEQAQQGEPQPGRGSASAATADNGVGGGCGFRNHGFAGDDAVHDRGAVVRDDHGYQEGARRDGRAGDDAGFLVGTQARRQAFDQEIWGQVLHRALRCTTQELTLIYKYRYFGVL